MFCTIMYISRNEPIILAYTIAYYAGIFDADLCCVWLHARCPQAYYYAHVK